MEWGQELQEAGHLGEPGTPVRDWYEGDAMIAFHSLKHAEFREEATLVILETLAHLPETQRNIFVWNHYRGCSVNQIAEMLDWKSSEIEAMLDGISSTLYQRTRGLRSQSSGGEQARRIQIAKIGRIKTSEIQCCGWLATRAVWAQGPGRTQHE